MMRSPSSWAVAVRKPDGEIAEVVNEIASPMAKRRIWRLPVIRGIIALGESLAIGFRALAISANYAAQDPEAAEKHEEVKTELSRGQLIFAFAIAIGFAIMLFKVTPALITNWLPIHNTGYFVVVEGAIRVTLFIAYLALISLLPDLRRSSSTRRRAQGDQRLRGRRRAHSGERPAPQPDPRALRDAFLLWVMVIAIFVFAFVGRPDWWILIISRIALLPVIAGLAYELIRFAGKHSDNQLLRALLAPGLWLQRLTTRQPSLEQLEVSIRALEEVLQREGLAGNRGERVEVMA